MDTMCIVTMRTAAFGTMGTIVQMPRITRRRKRSIGIHTNMNFRGNTVATRQGREFERGKGRMVIAATDESLCRRAMDAYFAALDQLHLPPHPIADFTYGTDYFEAKSKGPFRWCAAENGTRGCAPWVSFLGNQVRFDGAVRVRKDTVRKHVLKIKEEVGSAIGTCKRLGGKLRAGVKKSLLYKALRRRLVAKASGICAPALFQKTASAGRRRFRI